MKLKKSEGGIVYPEPPKGPLKIHTLEVYYLENLAQFLLLLNKNGAELLSIVKAWYDNGINRGWVVTYRHHEHIDTEVWC